MAGHDSVNILVVDDQPAKLLSYEVILKDLGETLVKANSAREALEHLLKTDIALILVDVCMPDQDGFELATMIRDHPRFRKIPIIFISAIQVAEADRLRGYEVGAVDYVPVPVVPEVLRAKVRIFTELHRKSRELEKLNVELERRVADRTAELEASTERLRQSEERRSLALAAAQMGSCEVNLVTGEAMWDEGQCRIFGISGPEFRATLEDLQPLIHPEDWDALHAFGLKVMLEGRSGQTEFRIIRPDGETRWCTVSFATTLSADGRPLRASGVTLDITERKEAEQKQTLLALEVDHRARNMLAVVQSILRLTRADSVADMVTALDGRIRALARAHTLLSSSRWQGADLGRLVAEEMDPYRDDDSDRVVIQGPTVFLRPTLAQALALALHELATNAAKYGALSVLVGRVSVHWELRGDFLVLQWTEAGGPAASPPTKRGFGTRVVVANIEQDLGGNAMFSWQAEGLKCTLSVPRSLVAEAASPRREAPRLQTVAAAEAPSTPTAGRRILLVEDEALVAIMMRDMLTDLGFSVVGPVGDRTTAIAAARKADIEGAVLDLNLRGETTYPVADELESRSIPFIFLTGYDRGVIDRRYADVPLLQKPVDEQTLQRALAAVLDAERPPVRPDAGIVQAQALAE
jgi:PAS domain S-box-containing protein